MTIAVVRVRRRSQGGRLSAETHDLLGEADDLFAGCAHAVAFSREEPEETFAAWRPGASTPPYIARRGELLRVNDDLSTDRVDFDDVRLWS